MGMMCAGERCRCKRKRKQNKKHYVRMKTRIHNLLKQYMITFLDIEVYMNINEIISLISIDK